MKRRTFLDLAASSTAAATLPFVAPRPSHGQSPRGPKLDLEAVKKAPGRVVPEKGPRGRHAPWRKVALTRTWQDNRCRLSLENRGQRPVAIKEVIAFSIPHRLPDATALYGESLQMLSQTAGTLGDPQNLGYDEVKHYKVPQPPDIKHATSGLLTLTPPGKEPLLLAFSSCRRFVGRFYLRTRRIDVVLDTEGLVLDPGQSWELEELVFETGPERAALLDRLAEHINRNHPPLGFSKPPTGWCSWYCFGPDVTAVQVMQNLDFIAKKVPQLKYVQIDDGYQPAMGDWLDTGKAFGGNVQGVLQKIRQRGFEPAIWVAPFIAEAESKVFRQHPEWFIRGEDGKPLPADKVTFGGWRRGPWYALDGTHPEVQTHFEALFSTMRKQWGCTYFKLDANFWGAMHGGKLHDPKATRIEAYRRGMAAILRGTGDGFVLGCNHPIWGSFGLIHGSRSSGDVKRTWARFKKIARENLSRNWQNGRLWWNDSDAVCLTGDLSPEEYQFHATAVWASGGMVLSGDDLTQMPAERLGMLTKLLPPSGQAAAFEDESLRVGRVRDGDTTFIAFFNEGDAPLSLRTSLDGKYAVKDFWTGKALGVQMGSLAVADLPPHSARLFICRPSAP